MLAGCGGGTAPLSPSLAGITAERTRPSHTYGVLYSFKGGSGDGEDPYAGLIRVKGRLYGTTYEGGANGDGTVFAITTSGAETVLHSFGGSGDGALPLAGLLNVKGTLYGTTFEGGANGDGTVFAITTSGAETVLYSFKGGSGDGADPVATLINVKGTLYGTTFLAGANGDGTVFKITTSGTETVLHNFPTGSRDGLFPYAGLFNVKGTLYSTTYAGGADSFGTVFSITTSGAETVLYSFKGAPGDGLFPYAGLLNVKGTLYGATYEGGANYNGTVFAVTTSGAETVLHSFGGSGDGEDPEAGLINVKGTLYGTTYDGGANGDGTVFAITTSGAETVLHSFKGGSGDGEDPEAGLLNVKGTLYGTTFEGGANGDGTVFLLKP
jgi:uncharacterized repeat protein (TIGR03803 family)